MIKNASIICLSSIDWSFNWHNPQEVAQAFAQDGNRVLFIENTGVRRINLRDARRLWFRFRNWWRAHGQVTRAASGVEVFSPVLLPFPYSRAAISINTRVLHHIVRRWLGDRSEPLILITFLPTPLVRALISALGPDVVVYYCLDNLAESSPGAREIVHSERALVAEADLVFVTSAVLHEMASRINPEVELLASGVRSNSFESARQFRNQPLEPFKTLGAPVVGYIGSIRSSTDIALITSAAELAPDLQFVLAGPTFVDASPLAARSNVLLLDPIPHEDVMRYMVRFDVGILPYKINPFTSGIMPVKLKEYLAAGLPVVATPLPELVRFAEEHKGLITLANSPQEFVAAIRAALGDNGDQALKNRMLVARRYDWSLQMRRMSERIEQKLTSAKSEECEEHHRAFAAASTTSRW